jgi:hypothetical protein
MSAILHTIRIYEGEVIYATKESRVGGNSNPRFWVCASLLLTAELRRQLSDPGVMVLRI